MKNKKDDLMEILNSSCFDGTKEECDTIFRIMNDIKLDIDRDYFIRNILIMLINTKYKGEEQ